MATTAPKPGTSATQSISYADLYARWESGNWRATEIDFTQDAIDWHEKLTDDQRRAALWLYTLFFHGEDSVTDNLSPYIDAAPLEEQKYFLTTQQVDEARHAVFFKRFMHEVVGLGDGTLGGGAARRPTPQINWGHRKVFDAPGRDGGRAAQGPLDAQARRGDDALPRRRGGQPGPVGPAHDRARPSRSSTSCRVPRRDAQRRPGRAAPHRLRGASSSPTSTPRTPAASATRSSASREVLPWTPVTGPPGGRVLHDVLGASRSPTSRRRGRASHGAEAPAIGLPVDDLPASRSRWTSARPASAPSAPAPAARATSSGPAKQPVVKDPEAVAILFDQMRRQADAAAGAARHDDRVGLPPTSSPGTSRCARAARSPPPGRRPARRPRAAHPRSQSWADLTARPRPPTRCGSSRSPARLRPKARPAPPAPRLGRVFVVGDGPAHATARPPPAGYVALRTCATALYRGLQMNPGPDDVQPVAHETLDRFLTGTVTVLPFVGARRGRLAGLEQRAGLVAT